MRRFAGTMRLMLVVVGAGFPGACGGKLDGQEASWDAGGADADAGIARAPDSSPAADGADATLDQATEAPPPDAGQVVTVLVSGEPPITDLAVDATHVYYVAAPARLKRVPKTGGPAETVNDGALDSGVAHAELAMGPTHLFWANALDGIVARIDKESGAMKILSSGQGVIADVTTTGAYLVWGSDAGLQALATASGSVPVTAAMTGVASGGIAATSDSIHFASATGDIVRLDAASLGQTSIGVVISSGQQDVAEMRAVEGGPLYWVLSGDGDGCGSTVRRAMPGAPAEAWVDLPCPQPSCGQARALEVAGTTAWVGREKCGLQKIDSLTGQVTDLGPPDTEARVVTDDSSVFWATSSGSVLRTSKGDNQ
ncbi:MAG: hypothetical protein IPM35_37340 [Myxococcales bacterium]|nr:hypothetical protein [Myxococcales bacterium]